MYADWSSLTQQLQGLGLATQSVLAKLPPEDGKQVVASVVGTVASNLGMLNPAEAKPSPLQTEQEVNWCMEVICHGLCLPLEDHMVIRDCVNIYCEWLSALLPNPKLCVPRPVLEQPNLYARKIITHFNHLFVPRKGEADDTIRRQAVVCHRVLRRVQELAQQSQTMERETWDSLLSFLLAINDALLAPPAVKDDVGDQLCERVLGVLYEIWLIACVKSFPGPTLWKTFQEMCMNWRHRTGLVTQWNRVNLALLAHQLKFMYGGKLPAVQLPREDQELVPESMTRECVAQASFRFLNSLGNPVELSRPDRVCQTQQFFQYAIVSDSVIDPTHHPCLHSLPTIFFKAMQGVSAMVDAYLGLPRASHLISLSRSASAASGPSTASSSLPPSMGPSFIASTSAFVLSAVTGTLPDQPTPEPSPARPRCSSLLHLFGPWLFEAAFIGSEFARLYGGGDGAAGTPSSSRHQHSSSSSSNTGAQRPMSLPGPASSLGPGEPLDLPPALVPDRFESGRAEALGALCRILCAKKTGEEILPSYLARFYMAIKEGMKVGPDKVVSECLASILLNSSNLMRIDLDGANLLAPAVVTALEAVLPEREVKLGQSNISRTDLRRCAIHLLESILALPLHFANMPIKDLGPGEGGRHQQTNFSQLKPRIVNLLVSALQVETETGNAQMLLGCLLLVVQDSAALEEAELRQSDGYSENSARNSGNIFAAASDTQSGVSDFTSLSGEEDSRAEQENHPDSAHALFVRATYLVCHRLISSWKSDLNTSLAALELLSGLARIPIPEQDALECKRAVKWVCDYIVAQCSRPPPAHSRDLHSSIVAAFQTCTTWLVHHPYLLQDKECLATVVEVAELGISGSKSSNRASDIPVMKEEKDLQPASRRVREAAEHLLSVVLEQVGYFPSACGAESLSPQLGEQELAAHCHTLARDQELTHAEAVKAFRYFVIDQSVVLAILEEPLGNSEDPQPTVTVLVRCPSNKAAWTLQLRHLPRHKSGQVQRSPNPGRPMAMEEQGSRAETRPTFFPDSIDRIPLCQADRSIPAVESVAGDERAAVELDRLSRLMEAQALAEQKLEQDTESRTQYRVEFECSPPQPCSEFQTARLILSHLGFLSLPALRSHAVDSPVPRLVALDNDEPAFAAELAALDRLPPRTHDTLLAFYVRAGQSAPESIVANSNAADLSPLYLELLAALGWPVQVATHPGWTGDPSTSWGPSQDHAGQSQGNPGPARFDGTESVLYWADVCSELAIVIPSKLGGAEEERPASLQEDLGTAPGNGERLERNHTSLSIEVGDETRSRKPGRGGPSGGGQEQKVVLIWLESLEDADLVPLASLVPGINTVCLVIFLQPLASGLIRVKLAGHVGKMNLATPLVDGMVISRRALGPLVRQTALNMCRRKRLEADTYQPPHVRRKHRIQELVQKYRSHMTEAEFYAHLFNSPCV